MRKRACLSLVAHGGWQLPTTQEPLIASAQLAVAHAAHRYRLGHLWLMSRSALVSFKATTADRVKAYNNLYAGDVDIDKLASSELKRAKDEYTALVGDIDDPVFAAKLDRTCETLRQSTEKGPDG